MYAVSTEIIQTCCSVQKVVLLNVDVIHFHRVVHSFNLSYFGAFKLECHINVTIGSKLSYTCNFKHYLTGHAYGLWTTIWTTPYKCLQKQLKLIKININ